MDPRKVGQGVASLGLGVLATFTWGVVAVPHGLPEMGPEAGAAVAAVAAPIYSGIMEILGAIKDRIVWAIDPTPPAREWS